MYFKTADEPVGEHLDRREVLPHRGLRARLHERLDIGRSLDHMSAEQRQALEGDLRGLVGLRQAPEVIRSSSGTR